MIVFGGVIEREVHNAFFTLDVRGWTEEQSELPREGWAQIEARLRDTSIHVEETVDLE